MKPLLAALLLLSSAAFGQTQIVGTIESLSGTGFRLKTEGETVSIRTAANTEVRKGKLQRGLSRLRAGDEVSVISERDSSGTLIASRIWADVVSFSGTVARVNGSEIVVSAPRTGDRLVRLLPGTVSLTTARAFAEGQQVHVVGIDVGNATVHATRISIYDTDIPAQPGR